MKCVALSCWMALCATVILICNTPPARAQTNVTLNSIDLVLRGDSVTFVLRLSGVVNITETTPCIANKIILSTGSNLSDSNVIQYRPMYNGSCPNIDPVPLVMVTLDPRDFVAALEAGIFNLADPLSIHLSVVGGMEGNFLPSVNLEPISTPLQISQGTPNTESPTMTTFDIDLSTSPPIMRFHFSGLMDLSTFSSSLLTMANGAVTYTLDRMSRPIGVETNLVKTVCVTLSLEDAAGLRRLGVCSERYGGCACFFTMGLITDYFRNPVIAIEPSVPVQANKFQSPSPMQAPELYMRLELTYIGCTADYNLTTDEVYSTRPREYVTRISCYASGENIWPTITFDGVEVQQTQARTMTWIQFPSGLEERDFGLYRCITTQREILHYIVRNEISFIGFPEGMAYSSRLYDSITIPLFYGSNPSVNISDLSVEIVLVGEGAFPDPVIRTVSPYRSEIYYQQAPNSIDGNFRVRVLVRQQVMNESDIISISITPPSVEVTPSAIALLPNDTQALLTCATNNLNLPIFWVRYDPGVSSPAILNTGGSRSYTVMVPVEGIRDETKFVCGVRDPDNDDLSTDNSEEQDEVVVTNIPEPISVFHNGEQVEDGQEIIIINQFINGSLILRCLGHAPSNVRDLVWVSERLEGPRVELQPGDGASGESDIRVWYSYNEANITIVNSNAPYRGILRCLSKASGMQQTIFVVSEASVGPPQMCKDGDVDDIYGISWAETNVESRNGQPCPGGSEISGLAFRLCGDGGIWEESVDVTNCLSDAFADFNVKADEFVTTYDSLLPNEQISLINEFTMTLRNVSSPQGMGLFPQELNVSNYAIQSIIGRLDGNSEKVVIDNVADILNNLLDENNIEEWVQLNGKITIEGGTNGGTFLFANIFQFGDYLRTAGLNTDTTELSLGRDNFYMNVGRFSGTYSDVLFPDDTEPISKKAQVRLPASILMEKQVTGMVSIVVKNLQDFLPQPPNEVNSTIVTRVGSIILSVQIFSSTQSPGDFTSGVIEFSYTTNPLTRTSNPVCVFWNTISMEWDTTGVTTTSIAKGEIGEYKTFDVKCESVHLSAFAVIVDQETETFAFTVPVYIGCGLIILSALMSIFSFLFSCILDQQRKFSFASFFTFINFCISLICAFVTFLAGTQHALQDRSYCVATAAILHYFFTAAFSWLFCETLILVFFSWTSRRWWSFFLLFLIGWGLPILPTVISVGVHNDEYGSTFHCWFFFDGEFGTGVALAFILPKLLIIVLILIFLMASICTMCTRSRELVKGQSKIHVYMLSTMWCGVLLLLILLCGTWVFAMLHVNIYGLDFSLTGWVFLGMSIALAVWLFIFTALVVIFTQKVDYEILWQAVDGNQTVDRRKFKEKKVNKQAGYSFSADSYPMGGLLPNHDSTGHSFSPDPTSTFLGGEKTNPLTQSEEERKIDY